MKNLRGALRHQLSLNTVAVGLKASTILAASIIVFYQDLAMIVNDALQSEFMSHILAIPFLFGYLIYRKRKMIRASMPFESSPAYGKGFPYKEIVGVLLFLIAFLTYSYGSYTFTPLEFHVFALPIFVAACILILFPLQVLRQLAFPILFLFFLVPPPTEMVYALGSTLSMVSTEVSCAMLNVFGLAAEISIEFGNPVITVIQANGTPLSFTVDIACSGAYSLIGFAIFATFVAYLARTKTWKKPLLFVIGLPLIYILNILRITIIVALGYYYGTELALNVFHIFGGWTLIFFGTLLLLIISEKVMRIQLFTRKRVNSCPQCNPVSGYGQDFCQSCGRLLKYADVKLAKLDIAKIAALAIGVILVISIQTPIFALVTGPTDILTQLAADLQPTTEILPEINNYTLMFINRDKEFEQTAKQDAALTYAYISTSGSRDIIWVSVEIASAKSSLHSWEACLITWPLSHGLQTRITQLDLREVQLIENPPLIARYFALQYKNDNTTQAVLYWYETSKFTTNTTTQQRHIKFSLIAYPIEAEEIQQVGDKLVTFGKAIANHWQPIKTWSGIALLISKNGSDLLLVPTALLIITVLVQTINQVKIRHANLKAYKKLSKETQGIIEATHQTKTMPTAVNIAATYKKLGHKPMTTDKLTETLKKAQETGLAKKELINIQDEPVLGWKTRISSFVAATSIQRQHAY